MDTSDYKPNGAIGSEPGKPARPSLAEVLSARNRLAASPTFARSRRLIRLLEFTIDTTLAGRAGEIKESTIGGEVYDRGTDFDPRADGIVRVEASRLRQKLVEYYLGAGKSDSVRIDYPKGSYVPVFSFSTTADAAPARNDPPFLSPPEAQPSTRSDGVFVRRTVFGLLAFLSCLAVAGVAYQTLSQRHVFVVRPGVVILSPVNLSGNQSDTWLSAALRELLTAELSADGSLRIPPGELVSRAERDLIPHPLAGLAADTFSDLTRTLSVETVLTGTYVVAGASGDRRVRVDLHIQGPGNTDSGEAVSETGAPEKLLELTSRIGIRLRKRLGVSESRGVEAFGSPAASPAASFYYSALERIHAYDPLGALRYLDRAVEADGREPMTWLARAQCLALLGRDPEAREAITRAFGLRGSLARERQLRIEAEYYTLQPSPARAADVLRALVTFYPDELDYRFQLVDALNDAGRYQDSLAEIAAMRALPAPLNGDPRIDWSEMKTAHKRTDFPRRLASARRLEAKARGLHADWLLAEALTREASPLARANRLPEATIALRQAREICLRLGDRACVAFSWRNEGTMLVGTGDMPGALEAFGREFAIGREIGSLTETGNALNGIGVVRGILGDQAGAREALEQLLAMSIRRQDQFGIKMANLNLADVFLNLGDLVAAESRYISALNLSRKLGESEGEAVALLGVGSVRLLGGEPAAAIARFEEAAAVGRRASNFQCLAEAAIGIANAHLAGHHSDLARVATAEASRLADKAGNAHFQIETRLTAARLALQERRFADAETWLRETKPLVERNRDVDRVTRVAMLAVELDLAQHRRPGVEIAQLKNIPAGTPKATALEATIILGHATAMPSVVAGALAEAHRLGLVLYEPGATR